jgi:hypothetical protein
MHAHCMMFFLDRNSPFFICAVIFALIATFPACTKGVRLDNRPRAPCRMTSYENTLKQETKKCSKAEACGEESGQRDRDE